MVTAAPSSGPADCRRAVPPGRNDLTTARPARLGQSWSVRPCPRRPASPSWASFGPPTGGGSTPDRFVDGGLSIGVPALEVYQVGGPPPPAARLAPASSLSAVVGSAEATSLPGVDDLPTSVIAPGGTKAPAAGGLRVLTDTPRRHEVNFGLGTKGVSQTLAPDDPLLISKPDTGLRMLYSPGAEAVARLSGAESVTAVVLSIRTPTPTRHPTLRRCRMPPSTRATARYGAPTR